MVAVSEEDAFVSINRYGILIYPNHNFSPPEVIGKRICWITKKLDPKMYMIYKMAYGGFP